ncbi:hypothetical protein GGI20_003149 [Coemansia sp. BCRC 34301]|nr:hypothetical protein GGI20_003149 [Coemansia sp. BCRC 34301]
MDCSAAHHQPLLQQWSGVVSTAAGTHLASWMMLVSENLDVWTLQWLSLALHVLGSLIILRHARCTGNFRFGGRAYAVSTAIFAVGILANFDKSPLQWLSIFPPVAVRALMSLLLHRTRLNSPSSYTMAIVAAIFAALYWNGRDAMCMSRKLPLHLLLLVTDACMLAAQWHTAIGVYTSSRSRSSPGAGPEDTEPLFSRLTYHWVLRSLRTHKVAVPPPASMAPHSLLSQFSCNWQHQVARGRRHPLAHTLARTFGSDLCVASALRLVVYFNDVVLPILVARLLRELSAPTAFSVSRAIIALSVYSLVSVVATVVEQNQIDLRDKAKLKIRVALTAAVHQSALLARNGSAEQADFYSCGIQNTQQLASHIVNLTGAIWLPVRVTAGLYVFYRQVGWAVVPGIGIVLLYLPLRKLLVSRSTRAQAQAAAACSQRVGLLTQLFENIISLRMLGWDRLLADRVQEVREHDELTFTVEASVATCLLSFVRTACRSGGPLGSLFIYSVYCHLSASGSNFYVTADQVYIVQAILRELFPLLIDVPHAFDSWWAARRPYEQIQGLLLGRQKKLSPGIPTGAVIQIADASFAWTSDIDDNDRELLLVPGLQVTQGQFVAVVGKVGAGKSSLLLAILGEMPLVRGTALVDRVSLQFAHVSQTPWLMSTTIRENILFGLAYDDTWYSKVIDACELRHDVDHLAQGDLTVVGSGGMALSGGQRVRVALARAVYARPDVVLLDNVLAAVDATVSRRLVDRVLSPATGLLAGTTCITVTQSPAVLGFAHSVCVVTKGTVSPPRPLNDLLSTDIGAVDIPALATPPNSGALRPATIENEKAAVAAKKSTLANVEVKRDHLVPVRYMVRLCGKSAVALHCVTVAAQCLASHRAQMWLAKPVPLAHDHPMFWHFAMCVLWWGADTALELGGQWWAEVVWRRRLFVKSHSELLSSTVGAPLRFFGDMSLGRLLALFTDSQADVDTRMPQRLANLAAFGIKLGFEAWVVVTFHPALVAAVTVVVLAMQWIVKVSRIPLAAHLAAQTDARPAIDEQFHESLAGAQTIRAFGAGAYVTAKLADKLLAFVGAQRAGDCVETWIDLAMSLLRCAATSTAFGVALVGAANGAPVDAAYLSLVYWSITFLLARIQHLVRHSHALHASLDRAAHFIEFTGIESEADQRTAVKGNADTWPSTGHIVFDNVCARYDQGGELALRRMSFTIDCGQHVGVVGRTGAGKTSIAMAMLRLLPLESGTIHIGAVDIESSGITPAILRERLSVVPQSAPMLPGTVRYNADPQSVYSDDEIQSALEAVGLGAASLDDDGSLEAWSAGQRQLLSVARALLKQSRVLVLDEATSSVDLQGSRQLHSVIRRKFAGCTVITIAHRLETIYDCDMVLVIDDGRVCEKGMPSVLLTDPTSRFAQMAAIDSIVVDTST